MGRPFPGPAVLFAPDRVSKGRPDLSVYPTEFTIVMGAWEFIGKPFRDDESVLRPMTR